MDSSELLPQRWSIGPEAIHEGNTKAVFIVPPSVTREHLGAVAQMFTGQFGGMPWEIRRTTFEVDWSN